MVDIPYYNIEKKAREEKSLSN